MKRTTSRSAISKKVKPKKQYTSFDEFLKAAYPSYSKNLRIKRSRDPFKFGAEMANDTSTKLKELLSDNSSGEI